MIPSGEFNILDIRNPNEAVYNIANKLKDLSNKVSLDEVIETVDFLETNCQILKKFWNRNNVNKQ